MTLQLRYLQTLTEIGVEKNTTIVFPLPIEMMQMLDQDQARASRPRAVARRHQGGRV